MLTTAPVDCLIRGKNCMNTSGSGVGRPSFGSRACRCRIAAPTSAAAIASRAISSGVSGKCGLIVGVWIDPVTAQVMTTLPRRGILFLPPADGHDYPIMTSLGRRGCDFLQGEVRSLRSCNHKLTSVRSFASNPYATGTPINGGGDGSLYHCVTIKRPTPLLSVIT